MTQSSLIVVVIVPCQWPWVLAAAPIWITLKLQRGLVHTDLYTRFLWLVHLPRPESARYLLNHLSFTLSTWLTSICHQLVSLNYIFFCWLRPSRAFAMSASVGELGSMPAFTAYSLAVMLLDTYKHTANNGITILVWLQLCQIIVSAFITFLYLSLPNNYCFSCSCGSDIWCCVLLQVWRLCVWSGIGDNCSNTKNKSLTLSWSGWSLPPVGAIRGRDRPIEKAHKEEEDNRLFCHR